jgi:Tfp pilus assembly protein PilN
MSGRGYGVHCPQCKELKPRNFFGGRGGTHKICLICRQANAKAVIYRRRQDNAAIVVLDEKEKQANIKMLHREFKRETAANRRSLRKLHKNLNPTEATKKAIKQRTQAQEMWQTALDALIRRIEKGARIDSIQQYFEGEP